MVTRMMTYPTKLQQTRGQDLILMSSVIRQAERVWLDVDCWENMVLTLPFGHFLNMCEMRTATTYTTRIGILRWKRTIY
jgi:hypothetical protein